MIYKAGDWLVHKQSKEVVEIIRLITHSGPYSLFGAVKINSYSTYEYYLSSWILDSDFILLDKSCPVVRLLYIL